MLAKQIVEERVTGDSLTLVVNLNKPFHDKGAVGDELYIGP